MSPDALSIVIQAGGESRRISWFSAVKVRVLSPAEWQIHDPDGRAFININTPEELQAAETLALKDCRQWRLVANGN